MTTVYNLSEDNWTWADEDRYVVVRQFLDNLEDAELKTTTKVPLYVGTLETKYFSDYLCVDSILERMQEWAYDDVDEFASEYLDDVTQGQKDELEQLISDWANKHNIFPKFFSVGNVKEILVDIPEDI